MEFVSPLSVVRLYNRMSIAITNDSRARETKYKLRSKEKKGQRQNLARARR